jgi:hypothetical protein
MSFLANPANTCQEIFGKLSISYCVYPDHSFLISVLPERFDRGVVIGKHQPHAVCKKAGRLTGFFCFFFFLMVLIYLFFKRQ